MERLARSISFLDRENSEQASALERDEPGKRPDRTENRGGVGEVSRTGARILCTSGDSIAFALDRSGVPDLLCRWMS